MRQTEVKQSQTRPTILVVEDDYLTAVAVCDVVRDCGFAVAGPVQKVESGLQLISTQAVQAAIIDINLNGTESYPLCHELGKRHVPFVFLTGHSPSSIAPKFQAVPLLPKPIDMQQLRMTLGRLASHGAKTSGREQGPDVNHLLNTLVEEDWRLIEPCLERIEWRAGEVIEKAGKSPSHVYFPTMGVASLSVSESGQTIEAALVGRDGLVGISTVMEASKALHDATVLQAGQTWRIPAGELSARFNRSRRLHVHCLAYAHAFMGDVSRTLLFTGRATLEERLARWLLTISHRIGSRDILVTHEQIALALAVRRAGVTVALHFLEGKRAISSGRGRIRIIGDRELELAAGPFYRMDRTARER